MQPWFIESRGVARVPGTGARSAKRDKGGARGTGGVPPPTGGDPGVLPRGNFEKLSTDSVLWCNI